MNTKDYQQLILEFIKEQTLSIETDEPYFTSLKTSIDLEVTRDISIWWRSLQIEKYCLITSNYLKLRLAFNDAIRDFYRNRNVSPYIERASESFLEYQQQSEDHLLATVAEFESTLQKVKKGDLKTYTIFWKYEPYTLLDMIIKGLPLDIETLQGKYLMTISHEIEDQFEVVEL